MFGLDFSELVVILVIALVVFGPDRLPELSRRLGKYLGQFRRTADSLRREFYNELYPPADQFKSGIRGVTDELRAVKEDIRKTLADTPEGKPPAPPDDPEKEQIK